MNHLGLDKKTREKLWSQLAAAIEDYFVSLERQRVTPRFDVHGLREQLAKLDFGKALSPETALGTVIDGLTNHQVHVSSPMYFGLFNPAVSAAAVAADSLVAAFNPQLAAWSHSPFAAEVDRLLIQEFARVIGFDESAADGTLCSGGAEANHTALLCALEQHFPSFSKKGLRGLREKPLLYVSAESHHSTLKAAKACGLGSDAVREIPVTSAFGMDIQSLREQVANDAAQGAKPFFVVATAGTTASGAIESISEIADIARYNNMWLHTDAAWGGAVLLLPSMKQLLTGIEKSDSVTIDAHKWLSVPMGCGLFITRHRNLLTRIFGTGAQYMPKDAAGLDVVDPYSHSLQWSRRAIGMKLFASLLVSGWEGYRAVIEKQIGLGQLLKSELQSADWRIVNDTALPVVCFNSEEPHDREYCAKVAAWVVDSGKAWISTVLLGGRVRAIRACITSYWTEERHVRELVSLVNKARTAISEKIPRPVADN